MRKRVNFHFFFQMENNSKLTEEEYRSMNSFTTITVPEIAHVPGKTTTTLTSSTTTCTTPSLLPSNGDRFSFLGNARTSTLVVCAVTLVGILAFLAIPLQAEPILFYTMKVYYTISAGMIVFGTIAIVRYSPISITIFAVFYVITALLSILASANSLRGQIMLLQSKELETTTRVILLIIIQSIQIVYWIVSSFIIVRFYNAFRIKYSKWKSMNNTNPDGHFQHWCYQNQICSQEKTSRNAILDSM
jgi:hypothetical protein